MVEKVYKIVFILFALELILLVVGITANKISYGTDLATSLSQMGIITMLFFISIIRFSFNKFDTKVKNGIGMFLIILMLFLMTYFLVEDTFKIEI